MGKRTYVPAAVGGKNMHEMIWIKRRHTMSEKTKGLLLILMFLYILSPIDMCPGPIDDLIVLLLGFAAQKNIA